MINYWTTINQKKKKNTGSYQKANLHPKINMKPQWGDKRDEILKKSNHIPARWVNHKLKNNYTTVLPKVWKS